MPAALTDQLTGDIHTALTAVAFAPGADRAFLRITGPDATRWLNGMVTNSIQALEPGEGNYSFLLNAQGRIQGDCTIYREPSAEEPSFLLATDVAQLDTIRQLLDKFIIMDDVELAPAYEEQQTLLLLGPGVAEHLRQLDLPSPSPLHLAHADTPQGPVLLYTAQEPGVPRVSVRCDAGEAQDLQARLTAAGVPQLSPEHLEALRILEARPRYGTDIRNSDSAKDLPQETNQTHALHFSKGCYLGQEIVERIRSRGQVHRLFTPFRLEGTPPSTFPTPLESNGKPAGELTSAAPVATTEGPVWLALGYARREVLDTHAPLTYATGKAHPRTPGNLT